MDNYTATEQAYKNGYEQGLKDAVKGSPVQEEELVDVIFSARLDCKAEHGCRNGADCFKCELLKEHCKNTYVARRILERYQVLEKPE